MKRYPFSIAKNAHNIELIKNAAYNRGDEATYQKAIRIWLLVTDSSPDGRIAWLTGKDYGEAMEMVASATAFRDACNRR